MQVIGSKIPGEARFLLSIRILGVISARFLWTASSLQVNPSTVLTLDIIEIREEEQEENSITPCISARLRVEIILLFGMVIEVQ